MAITSVLLVRIKCPKKSNTKDYEGDVPHFNWLPLSSLWQIERQAFLQAWLGMADHCGRL